MNKVLTEKLYSNFPQLYSGHRKTKYESAMHWGFDCGDGWYQLLYDLSQQLDNYLTLHPSLQCEVVDVKSKFGTLRFRLSLHDPIMQDMILTACNRATITCEHCGRLQADGSHSTKRCQ